MGLIVGIAFLHWSVCHCQCWPPQAVAFSRQCAHFISTQQCVVQGWDVLVCKQLC